MNAQNPAEALKVQNWYMGRIKDDLPLMENIRNCSCPRVYMPVCGTDNKTYTNVCWMNCVNRHKRLTKKGRLASLFHRGFCQTFIDPFQFAKVMFVLDIFLAVLSIIYVQSMRTPKPPHHRAVLPPLDMVMPCEECPDIYFPVCASNNKTYINLCQLTCRELTDVRVVRKGICIFY
ncbi:hypothetical protein K1T71_012606 [Dendrolimus kikuchii]|uniref:Uncharacterized protein n=1 Tax=Dendrolimus kikuchii TaxID=765133 RepID=A0ACC1CJU1_9NEOP|nr:hypothetical protein K1T71_012606 [Dendrolimus kikuchii]